MHGVNQERGASDAALRARGGLSLSLCLCFSPLEPVERVLINRAAAPAQRAHPHRVIRAAASQTVIRGRVPVDGGDRTAAGVRRQALQRERLVHLGGATRRVREEEEKKKEEELH